MSQHDWACVIVPTDQEHFRPVVHGMGILVNDRTVVTCAHVVNEALGQGWPESSEAIVRVCFPFTEGPAFFDGVIDREKWYAPGNPERGKPTDIAVIGLDRDAPGSIGRAVLAAHVVDAKVKIYGFRGRLIDGRWQSHPEGEIAVVNVIGSVGSGRIQLDGLRTGAAVERGFSGAGVYDPRQDAVVGMVAESDRDQSRRIALAIAETDLSRALRERRALVEGLHPAKPSRAVDAEVTSRTRSKLAEVETYLAEVSRALKPPGADAGLQDYLEPILTYDSNADSLLLRRAFGFPRESTTSHSLYEVIRSHEPSLQPVLGLVAQRMDHLLWRYEATLKAITADWAPRTARTAGLLRAICEPHLIARRPTLLDITAALRFQKELESFTESAPDPTLYAVLRAIGATKYEPLPVSDTDEKQLRAEALNFVHDYLMQLIEGERELDDSSNAWWSIRTGIDQGDYRFLKLLPGIAEKYKDVRVPSAGVTRIAAVPEIHKPLRTTSYTLSNIQHIVETVDEINEDMRKRLHAIITVMLDRLLRTPRSNQLYLASVHHEGLRNFLDYVRDQGLAE